MRPTTDYQNIQSLTISLLSPEEMLSQSYGEITEAETINYRTFKPEKHGLFCEQTFGPVKDWECHCGKYRRIRYKGIICDRCGVEVTEKKVRRQRMGHIELVEPMAHIWYFKKNPNKISALLDIAPKKLEQVIYFARRVVLQPGIQKEHQKLELITEEQYDQIIYKLPPENQQLPDTHPDKFIAEMGARAIETLLKQIDLNALSQSLKHQIKNTKSQLKRKNALKRLQIVESFHNSSRNITNKPEWMMLRILPVIPPDLRPLIFLEGGRFATADLNNLYRKVIIRNKRLKKLLEIKAPEVICRNEKRMLQEAVDALLDTSRSTTAGGQRPLKSLTNILEGKKGRFRQDLLGKRVDYSGRSVIVVGPELQLHECGLPKEMAAELFKPFIIRRLLERGIALTVKDARNIIHQKEPVIWEILENVLKGRLVLLNRAPTLHRLGIQAYQPKLIEGRAIQLHPLSCTAFNADFDGDQMAVHVPLSQEALLEAQLLMLSSHNLLNPSNGAPIALPTKDMILGLYYLTKEKKDVSPVSKNIPKVYSSIEEVHIAFNNDKLKLHSPIKLVLHNNLIETTPGRVIFNQYVPQEIGYINELITMGAIRRIVTDIYRKTNIKTTAEFLNNIKNLGFQYAHQSGITLALEDIQIPSQKEAIIKEAQQKIDHIFQNYQAGFITDKERYNQVVDVWTRVTTHITKLLKDQLQQDQSGFNTIHMMMDSGARGSMQQTRQLAGIKGLIGKVQKILRGNEGDIIENAIVTCFKEGMNSLEYFTSAHGARKGLTDMALKTADAGYLTRRLVNVAQNLTITGLDCSTRRGKKITARYRDEEVVETLAERILGRTALYDIHDPANNQLICKAGEEINEEVIQRITQAGLEAIHVRSIFTCDQNHGFCAKCYGRNLATGRLVNVGEAVGVIAAQSIGEPGTQLTMNTFHLGGITAAKAIEHTIRAKATGVLHFENLKTIAFHDPEIGEEVQVVIGRAAEMQIIDPKTKFIQSHTNIPYGVHLKVQHGEKVEKGDSIYDWDPYNALILANISGHVAFDTIQKDLTYKEVYNKQTGHTEKVIISSKDRTKNPKIIITNPDGSTHSYNLPVGAHLLVTDQSQVHAGQILAKIPRITSRGTDITSGLPRVTALFEARVPSKPSVITIINGIISYGDIKRNKQEIFVTNKNGARHKHLISLSKHILVQEGDYINAGVSLCDGKVAITDILNIHGVSFTQDYIVDKIKDVYRLQGVKINDKHLEIIIYQMLQKVVILDPGDTNLIMNQIMDHKAFQRINQQIVDHKIILNPGAHPTYKIGDIISVNKWQMANDLLKEKNQALVTVRDAQPAIAKRKLQGITKAAIHSESFLSAASFQETAKVLSRSAIASKKDTLQGLNENIILGKKIPAGTGLPNYRSIMISSQQEQEDLLSAQHHFDRNAHSQHFGQ